MTHLTIEQLIGQREPGVEPGDQAARVHLEACESCRAELDRLHQRVARLKALPALRPSRDRWPVIRARLVAERRALRMQRIRRVALAGLAAAASVTLVVTLRDVAAPEPASAATEISRAMERSRALERTIDLYHPESRVLDGRTARIAQEIEDRIAALDRELELLDVAEDAARDTRQLRLWRERVGLLDALVDVHLTRASNVGL
ncbi:MAG TPA: hypothetical protein VFU46_01515 [Gemmatimonadales bacterium]|nr:hypothetical protein [Gemmatimonadales bacterium]